jgi:aminoglycoside 3-N-acetyltransferase I
MVPASDTDFAVTIKPLAAGDHERFAALMSVFGNPVEEPGTCTTARPGRAYADGLLESESLVLLVARDDATVIGGLAACELRKFERERSEIYVYDLAVAGAYRRRGIATALLKRLSEIAAERGAWTIFVQADRGDEPAIELYADLGTAGDVLHFDLPVPTPCRQ